MGAFLDWLLGSGAGPTMAGEVRPQNGITSGGGGTLITTPDGLADALRTGGLTASGQAVTPDTAMQVAAVYASARLLSGIVATLPCQVKRRVDDRKREDARDHPLWAVLNRRPNKWQKPAQFKRMMHWHVLMRGNGYAMKIRDIRGRVIGLLPLHSDRVVPVQGEDMTIAYRYTRANGGMVWLDQADVLHLYMLTLDGVRGVTPLTFAREAIGAARSMERHGSTVFANGANVSGVLSTDRQLKEPTLEHLRQSMTEFRNGGAKEGQTLILEEGLSYSPMAMTSDDAQWIEGRKFTRSEIFMFFGVFPHMVGDAEGNTQLGSSLEQQTEAFKAFSAEDHLTMWEEGLSTDCLPESEWASHYVRFERNALVRGDIKTRGEFYKGMMQFGVYSPNEIRALEDENPRPGGDVYYDPPNMAGGQQREIAQ